MIRNMNDKMVGGMRDGKRRKKPDRKEREIERRLRNVAVEEAEADYDEYEEELCQAR